MGGNANLDNYTLTQATDLSAKIAAKALTVTGTVASDTTYNGTTAANLSGGKLVGVVEGENVTLTQAGTYTSADAGTRSITANASLGGNANLDNYTLTQATGLSATIAKAAITLADVTVTDRAYNGNTDATVGGTITGLVDGESLTLSGQFASKDVASEIAVTVSTADGTNGLASNYVVTDAGQSVVANIHFPTTTPETPTAPLNIPNGTTLEALISGALTAASMISIPGVNPTVGELTANKSTSTESTENGVKVVTNQLDDGSKSLRIINDGMTASNREVDTEDSDAANPNPAVVTGG